ncbi:MAG: hypothetical protein LBW85_07875 [Deltaproteobacteria bacterium]|nr:hypothetical protein [Deltaproteobacteria bacterium]
MDNYLFAESAIAGRLAKALEPDKVPVECIGSTDDIAASRHRYPCVYVLYAGDEVSETSAGRGEASRADQFWVASVCSANAGTLASGAAAREEAGKIFMKVLKALQGFEIASGRALTRVSCPLPVTYENGHMFMAAQFKLSIDVQGGL